MLKVGFIGLGAMGEWMAKNLAKADFLHSIYNRTTTKSLVFAQKFNVQIALSPEELAKEVEVICSSLYLLGYFSQRKYACLWYFLT